MSVKTDVHWVRRWFWVCAFLFLAAVGLAGWARAQESGARDRIYAVTHVDILPTDAAAGTKLVQQYVMDSEAHEGAAHTKKFREQIDPMLGSPYDERLHTIAE
jgi:hypothetical protein